MKMPSYYSKKPVVIKTMQYDGSEQSASDIVAWTKDSSTYAEISAGALRIKTLESGEGWHIVSPGDWVICGVSGEHYPCKPDIFEKTYQEERGYPYDRPEHTVAEPASLGVEAAADNLISYLVSEGMITAQSKRFSEFKSSFEAIIRKHQPIKAAGKE